jgi:integrase
VKGPKSKAGKRSVPIPQWFLKDLRRHRKYLKGYRLFFPYFVTRFPENQEKKEKVMDEGTLWRLWLDFQTEFYKRLGAEPYISPYFFQHTYCIRLAQSGVHMKTAQYLMGHADVKIVANIYMHVNAEMMNEAAAILKRQER